jgi:magnesium-transporting ATPase (P-type)
MYVKGAPDRLLPLCKTQLSAAAAAGGDGSSGLVPLDPGFWQQAQAGLSSQGLRVLALCRCAGRPGYFAWSLGCVWSVFSIGWGGCSTVQGTRDTV